jgi:hypothetical protein
MKFERRVAELFGCRRRGHEQAGRAGGDDLTHEHYAVECKLLTKPTWSSLVAAARQAERSANGREPIAVVKASGAHDDNALVVMRLETFREWRL